MPELPYLVIPTHPLQWHSLNLASSFVFIFLLLFKQYTSFRQLSEFLIFLYCVSTQHKIMWELIDQFIDSLILSTNTYLESGSVQGIGKTKMNKDNFYLQCKVIDMVH